MNSGYSYSAVCSNRQTTPMIQKVNVDRPKSRPHHLSETAAGASGISQRVLMVPISNWPERVRVGSTRRQPEYRGRFGRRNGEKSTLSVPRSE